MVGPQLDHRKRRLVTFDLDGTLIPGTSTTLFLAEQLGHLDRVIEYERRYREGEISNETVALETGALLEGVSMSNVESLFRKIPKIANIDETVAILKQRGYVVILGSITWKFFVQIFAQTYGFADCCGTGMESVNGILTGRVTDYCTERDKLSFFRKWRKQLSIRRSDTIAVGDSRSDHLVFSESSVAIALNADHATRSIATHTVESNDLMDIIPHFP